MSFTTEEVDIMRAIFKRLDPKTIESVQFYTKNYEYRTGCTFIINNKQGKAVCLFQNFEPLSPYRMRLLMRLSKKISYPLHITQPHEDIMTIGWKIE